MGKSLGEMTVDELDELSTKLRGEIDEARALRRMVKQERDRKVNAERIQDRIQAAGLDGIVVALDTAELVVEGKGE